MGITLYKVKHGKLDSRQGNTFTGVNGGGPDLWCQVQSGEGPIYAPHASGTMGYYSPTLDFEFCFSRIKLAFLIHILSNKQGRTV